MRSLLRLQARFAMRKARLLCRMRGHVLSIRTQQGKAHEFCKRCGETVPYIEGMELLSTAAATHGRILFPAEPLKKEESVDPLRGRGVGR